MQTKLAKRFNQHKPQLSYLLDFKRAVEAVARVFMSGAEKYGRDNWRNGRPFRDTMDSLLRHAVAFQNGEQFDPESGNPHSAMILSNALLLCEYDLMNRPDLDDRYKGTGPTSAAEKAPKVRRTVARRKKVRNSR